jgi:hypothetical protein
MSAENTIADRLLNDARKKTAREENSGLGKVALGLGIVALLVSPVSIAGWIMGVITLVTGGIALQRPAAANLAKIALALGGLAILVGVFFFTLNLARA